MSPLSGTCYQRNPTFTDRKRLALQLYFDAISTSRNALGRAATASRKFYVFSVRVANVPEVLRDAEYIVPIAIVPPSAWAAHGFDGIAERLKDDFDIVDAGVLRQYSCLLLNYLIIHIAHCCWSDFVHTEQGLL